MGFKHALTLGPVIGNGHFGDVHEGVDPIHGKVAVKLLRPFPGEPHVQWLARRDDLLKEGQNLQRATHPNIVKVLNLVLRASDDLLHLIMEFCDGGSVETEYKSNPIHLSRVKDIISDSLTGLEAIHSSRMIHRDIKPGNLLKHNRRCKIGDFGLVSEKSVYGYASVAGYLDHLAPEVYFDGVTSVRTDIWAMGMTLYRLINGHAWYQLSGQSRDIEELVKSGGFAQRLRWLPHVPEKWRRLVRKAMHDDSNQRLQNAVGMNQALAPLPTPDWSCNVAPSKISWRRKEGNREIAVEWEIISPLKHQWSATRTGGGKRLITIASSKGVVSKTKALETLEGFFDGQQ